MKKRLYSYSFLLFIAIIQTVSANTEPFRMTAIAENLGITWGMAFLDKTKMIFTQRSGKVGILNTENGKILWLKGVPEVYDVGQGGLLDVRPSPDYAQTGWIYFTYSKPVSLSAVTTLARAKVKNNELIKWQDLLITQSESYRNIHFGSRIAFDHQGHVFFTVGDRGERANAQDLTTHAGSVIRLNLDGSVPKDNPFVNNPDALDEIWSYGHRNPQGLFYDVTHQRLWEMEHGPRGGDEINLIQKGQNYGWPIVSQGREYFSGQPVGIKHQSGMIEPVKVFIPSTAPSDLLLYTGKPFPKWQNSLFSGALALTHLNRIQLDDQGKAIGESRYLEALAQRVRSLTTDSEGYLYIATDNGTIYKLIPK